MTELNLKLKKINILLTRMVAVLSISGGSLDPHCKAVVNVMKELNVCGDVTPNHSIYNQMAEYGCRVAVVGKNEETDVKRLWYHLRNVHSLDCAHVEMKTHKSGCVFDVFAPSKCPSKV